MPVALSLIAAVVLIAFGGFMAAADAALGVVSRQSLEELADRHPRRARALRALAADPMAHMNATNFMRIAAETTAAVCVTLLAVEFLSAWGWQLGVSAFVMIAVSFVLVSASPRSVGRAHSEKVLLWAAPVVRGGRVLLGPFADALVNAGNRVTPGVRRSSSFSSEEQLLNMVDQATEQDVLEEDDRELIHSIFEFSDTIVREVMVPRTDMITLDADLDLAAGLQLFFDSGVSRMPVIDGDVDDVHGIVYLRDIARRVIEGNGAEGTVRALAKPALFVPELQKADSLLALMRSESTHLAMVVDEYGGIAGLVTMEDLIEELVGEISDEYDRDLAEAIDLGDGRYRLSARLGVDELAELFDVDIDEEDVDSVGGLLAKSLGRLPERGSRTVVAGIALEVEQTQDRGQRIATVIAERISGGHTPPPEQENPHD